MSFHNFFQGLTSWFLIRGIKIVLILILAWITTRILRFLISKIVRTIIEKGKRVLGDEKIQEQRIKTLTKVFKSSLLVIIWTIAILTILPEFGINIAPLLAGAGLAGLAIGMGARNLIQDYFSGLFILLEDQYREGEEIEVGGKQGIVVDLNLRRTVIKDKDGNLHYLPNGQIKIVSNFSRK